jgi:hypothetical protein
MHSARTSAPEVRALPTTGAITALTAHPRYYGAHVLDPDGNNIEPVCQQPG